jgi:protein phosphatase 1E
MESQLNPDAAEFVPSPTQIMSPMEEVLLAQSPSKGIIMEDIPVPSQTEFQHEIIYRPSELDLASEALVLPENKVPSKLPDLIATEEGNSVNPFIPSPDQMENKEALSNNLEKQESEIFSERQNIDVLELMLDESEVTSTKAEFGDDSASFLTIGSELQKTVTECVSLLPALEKSFTDLDLQETEFMPYVAKADNSSTRDDNELSIINENEVCMNKSEVKETALYEGGNMVLESVVSTCFEVQKELVPEVESMLEKVKLESEDTSSLDDSGSPLQVEGQLLEESAVLSQVPYLPVSCSIPNLNPVVAEEETVISRTQEPSLQDLIATDILLSPAGRHVSSAETELFMPEQVSTPIPQSSLCGSTSPVPTSTPEIVSPLVDMLSKPTILQGPEAFQFKNPDPPCHLEPYSNLFPESDTNSMRDLVEREEEHRKSSEITLTPGSFDLLGNIESTFKITDPNHYLKEDVYSEIQSSVLEQHSVLRNDDNQETPAYDEVLRDTVNTIEDRNQKTFPVSHIPVEPPVHSVKAETEECVVSQIPPSAPEHISEEMLQLLSVETKPVPEEPFQGSEKVVDTVSEGSFVAASVVGTALATAVSAGVAVAQEKPSEEVKAPERNLSKKPTTADKKETTPAKIKAAKTPVSSKTTSSPNNTARILLKSKPSSPAKPPTTTLRSSTLKNSLSSGTPPASKATKPSAATNKPKPGATSPTKPLSSLKSTGVSPRTQTGATATKSATVSNGDITKPSVVKKTSACTAAKLQSRPATAPASTKTGTAKQMGTATSRTNPVSAVPPQLKAGAVNVGASKTRSAGTVATGTLCSKVGPVSDTKLVTSRQKQMSTTHTVSNRTVTAVTAHSTTKPAARRIVAGVTKTTVISSAGKVGPKKTTTSMPNSGTRASTTASTKTTKTEVTVTSMAAENNK